MSRPLWRRKSNLSMLLASAAAAAWLSTPVRSDVEAKLPADLRSDAWERHQKTAGDDPERIQMLEEFSAEFTRFPAPSSARYGLWLFNMAPDQQRPELVSWVAGRVVEPPGDPGEEVWLIDTDQRIGVLGADRNWLDCIRFTDPDGHPVRPYALFPSLKTGLFGIGEEMVLAGWE